MKKRPTLNHYRKWGLLPFQSAFIEQFVNAASNHAYQTLIAPPGLGKTHTCIAIVRAIIEERSGKRILILVPKVLVTHYFERIVELFPEYCTIVDRRTLREFEAAAKNSGDIWPKRIIAVMSIDTVKQKDVQISIQQANWDLVIIDELRAASGARVDLINNITRTRNAKRLLMVGNDSFLTSFGNLQETRWTFDVVDWEGKPVFSSRELNWQRIEYSRTDAEVLFYLQLREFLSQKIDYGQAVKDLLLSRAYSSLFAAEQTLQRLAVREWFLTDDEQLFTNIDEPEIIQNNGLEDINESHIPDHKSSQTRLEHLLTLLSQVVHDSKLEALKTVVHSIANDSALPPHVIVTTSFKDTASYVHSGLADIHPKCYTLNGSIDHTQREVLLKTFLAEGGVLVCTFTILENLPFRTFESVIHYDIPTRLKALKYRVMKAHGNVNYILYDRAKAIPEENEILDTVQNVAYLSDFESTT